MKRRAIPLKSHPSLVPLASSLAGTLVAGLLSAVLVGCSTLSPATIATPYAAADGINGSLPNAADGSSIDLRNVLVVAAATGPRGRLVGTLVNSGGSPVQVAISVREPAGSTAPAPVRVAVPAGGVVQLGEPGTPNVIFSDVPQAGRLVDLLAQTTSGGTVALTVPVVAPSGFYATLTPPPAASAR